MKSEMESELTELRRRIEMVEEAAPALPDVRHEDGRFNTDVVLVSLMEFVEAVGTALEEQSPTETVDALRGLAWCSLDLSSNVSKTYPKETGMTTSPAAQAAPLPDENPAPPVTIVQEDPTIAYYAFALSALALVVALAAILMELY